MAVVIADRASGGVTGPGRLVDAIARRVLLRALRGVRDGSLTLVDGATRAEFGRATPEYAVAARVQVHRAAFYSSVVFGGSVGAGASFMRGDWSCDDPAALCRLLVKNRDAFREIDGWLSSLARPWRWLAHLLRRNTRAGSRRNIAAHYDLSNEFFALWLDPTMMYSCAIFEEEDGGAIAPHDLERAQLVRLERLCRRLELSPADHLLEIGTGWGGLAMHAAGKFGCRVTTTTISREQAALARERIARAGLSGRVTVLEQDYRDLTGTFDKLVSVEMIEAVGAAYVDGYFAACDRLLRPGGLFMLQAIVIDDRYYEEALGHVDFIKKYIFPGSFMPCRRLIRESVSRSTGMGIVEMHEIGRHYALTLAEWRRRFMDRRARVLGLGFDDRFVRMWEFYLAYCEAGFAEGHLGDVQVLMRKGRP